MITWEMYHPEGLTLIGFLPQMIHEDDKRPLREQLDSNYRHGGGWRPMQGWTFNPKTTRLRYPGDDPLMPVASARVRDELMLVYPHSWVVLLQADGSFECARMD